MKGKSKQHLRGGERERESRKGCGGISSMAQGREGDAPGQATNPLCNEPVPVTSGIVSSPWALV